MPNTSSSGSLPTERISDKKFVKSLMKKYKKGHYSGNGRYTFDEINPNYYLRIEVDEDHIDDMFFTIHNTPDNEGDHRVVLGSSASQEYVARIVEVFLQEHEVLK